jgi:hypothetical protein
VDELRRKYFGDHPDRSIQTFALCRQIEIASSCHETTGAPGRSSARESRRRHLRGIGFEYLSRSLPPPGKPVPIPL